MAVFSRKNPHGDISKAFEIMKKLKKIWLARGSVDEKGDGPEIYVNMGVISDGSIGTIKGEVLPLPLVRAYFTSKINKIVTNKINK